MPGIYIHIPYCRKACHYCNFHFSTTLRSKTAMVEAIVKELALQKDYLGARELDSVYFGGGTPSLLETSELRLIFNAIENNFRIRPDAEITLEANPDDLSADKLKALRNETPVNRLSIGIQSFSDEDLRWMNRAHEAKDAFECLKNASKTGFDDLTIDLIYGAPVTGDEQWAENLRIAFDFDIPHLSCYCLTVEEGTALASFVRKGKQSPVDEEHAARQFEYLMNEAARHGYEQYEISNFAKPGRYARHNSSYWKGESYLGVGPAAHSFNGVSRQWNIANNALYIKSLGEDNIPFEREVLTPAQQYNEYVMISLRTMWGAEEERIEAFGEYYLNHFRTEAEQFVRTEKLRRNAGKYYLTREGVFLADRIASDLFVPENP